MGFLKSPQKKSEQNNLKPPSELSDLPGAGRILGFLGISVAVELGKCCGQGEMGCSGP
jgi:hypothetical protein